MCIPPALLNPQHHQQSSVLLRTSRVHVYCWKRRDHNGSFQSQHFLHGCTRKLQPSSKLSKFYLQTSLHNLQVPLKPTDIWGIRLLCSGVSWPSGLAYRTQVLVLAAECGFESRPWHLCPWARHLIIIASLHPGVKWVPVRAELVD